jgi:hypothetical protein
VPTEILAKYAVSLLDGDGNLIAGQSIPKRMSFWSFLPGITGQNNEFEVPVSPVGNGLICVHRRGGHHKTWLEAVCFGWWVL